METIEKQIVKLRELANDNDVDMVCTASLQAHFEEAADTIEKLLEYRYMYEDLCK